MHPEKILHPDLEQQLCYVYDNILEPIINEPINYHKIKFLEAKIYNTIRSYQDFNWSRYKLFVELTFDEYNKILNFSAWTIDLWSK